MGSYSALIERLEAVTGPNRELDDAIWQALCWEELWRTFSKGTAFTASIDAALALVEAKLPDWTAWELCSRGGKQRFVFELSKLLDDHQETYEVGRSRHPPLAILIALLRALEAKP